MKFMCFEVFSLQKMKFMFFEVFDDQFLKGIKEIFKNKNHYRIRVLLGGVFYDGVNIANYIELNFCFC